MRTLVGVVLCLVSTGCGPTIKSATPNHVIVESYQMNIENAQRVADGECAKYQRRAEIVLKATPREQERDYLFACVE